MNETKKNLRDFWRLVQNDGIAFGVRTINNVNAKYPHWTDEQRHCHVEYLCNRWERLCLSNLFSLATSDAEVGAPLVDHDENGLHVHASLLVAGMNGIVMYDGSDGEITTHTPNGVRHHVIIRRSSGDLVFLTRSGQKGE